MPLRARRPGRHRTIASPCCSPGRRPTPSCARWGRRGPTPTPRVPWRRPRGTSGPQSGRPSPSPTPPCAAARRTRPRPCSARLWPGPRLRATTRAGRPRYGSGGSPPCCATTPRRRSPPSSRPGSSTRHWAIGAGLPGRCRTSPGHTSSPGASTTRKPSSTTRRPSSPTSVTGADWDGRSACWHSRASIPATRTKRRPWPSRSSAAPRRQATGGPWAWDRCSPPASGCGRDGPSRPSSGPGRPWRPSMPSTTTMAACRRSSRWAERW